MTQFAIETDGLSRSFGAVQAVRNVDLQVPRGSIFGFLGPNGSGKTTTFRLLLGLIRADAGTVLLNGANLRTDRVEALSRIGAIVENPALYPNLTGREILRVSTLLLKIKATEIDRVLDVVDLRAAADRRVQDYSLGMRQRLALARSLMGDPGLLMLDEPTNGLDPAGISDMRRLIKSLPDRSGTTVFVSSHQLLEMEQMTDHCAVIKSGQLLYQGRLDGLMSRARKSVFIETDNVDLALAVAKQAGLEAAPDATPAASGILIHAALDQSVRADLIGAIIRAGGDVSQAYVRETSLEVLFLSLTQAGNLSS